MEAAHWKLDGTLCDFNEVTGQQEPISREEEDVVRDVIAAALDALMTDEPVRAPWLNGSGYEYVRPSDVLPAVLAREATR